MAACQHTTGLPYLLRATLQDAAQNVQIHFLGETHDIQRGFYRAAHGVNIAEGVGSRNLAENIRILHHGREEIQRLYHGNVIGELVHRGIVRMVEAYQQIGIGKGRKFVQRMGQCARAQFGSASATLAEYNWLFIHNNNAP